MPKQSSQITAENHFDTKTLSICADVVVVSLELTTTTTAREPLRRGLICAGEVPGYSRRLCKCGKQTALPTFAQPRRRRDDLAAKLNPEHSDRKSAATLKGGHL